MLITSKAEESPASASLTYQLFPYVVLLDIVLPRLSGLVSLRHIKTYQLKYKFLAGKIIGTIRSVVTKLSEKYPYREICEKSLP